MGVTQTQNFKMKMENGEISNEQMQIEHSNTQLFLFPLAIDAAYILMSPHTCMEYSTSQSKLCGRDNVIPPIDFKVS